MDSDTEREKREARPADRPTKTYRGNRRRDRWLSYRTARTAAASQIVHNRAGLFLYAKRGRSGMQERRAGQGRRAWGKQNESRNVYLPDTRNRNGKMLCTKQVRPRWKTRRSHREEKEKGKGRRTSLAPALRVSKRSLVGAIVENYLDARENCLPACERDNRRGARWFSDCNSPGNWYTRIISSTFKRRFEISSRRYNLARSFSIAGKRQDDFLFSWRTSVLSFKYNCKMFV